MANKSKTQTTQPPFATVLRHISFPFWPFLMSPEGLHCSWLKLCFPVLVPILSFGLEDSSWFFLVIPWFTAQSLTYKLPSVFFCHPSHTSGIKLRKYFKTTMTTLISLRLTWISVSVEETLLFTSSHSLLQHQGGDHLTNREPQNKETLMPECLSEN